MSEVKKQQIEKIKQQIFLAKVQKKIHESNARQTESQINELEQLLIDIEAI